jgi:hypothetical protein
MFFLAQTNTMESLICIRKKVKTGEVCGNGARIVGSL